MASGAICLSTPMDFGTPWFDHVPIVANSSSSIVNAIRAGSKFADQSRGSTGTGVAISDPVTIGTMSDRSS